MGTKKSVGIITMHKVLNYGSALQAYALQRKIEDLGYESHLIDYVYPNELHITNGVTKFSIRKAIRRICRHILFSLLYRKNRQLQLFSLFWEEHFRMTKTYKSKQEIFNNPPEFDIYVTGSDQVWNPTHMKGDSTFFCDFLQNGNKRISYASSFSKEHIDENYAMTYRDLLNKYTHISVRENTGVNIVRELTSKEAVCTCDPTLLLTKDEYAELSVNSSINIERPYILAYILNYNFNPYPTIQNLIDKISKETKLPVVYLLCNTLNAVYRPNAKVISAAGPNEFLWLFQHASYIVTSSFHGTAFSLIYEKPFYAITDNCSKDNRIKSLLEETGTETRLVHAGDDVSNMVINELDYSLIKPQIEKYRNSSIDYLKEAL